MSRTVDGPYSYEAPSSLTGGVATLGFDQGMQEVYKYCRFIESLFRE